MDPFVFFAVLFAAACHAGWNAAIKRGLEPLATTVLISIGAGAVSIPLPGHRMAGSRSVALGDRVGADPSVYFAGLIESYRTGDMGQVYPIARGSAPLMTALVGHTVYRRGARCAPLARHPPACLRRHSALAARRTRFAKLDRRAVGFALFTAVTICAYSVVEVSAHGGPAYQCLFGRFVRRHRSGDGSLRAPRSGACARDRAALAHWVRRGHAAAWLVRHRDLGDDAGADRDRGGVARDQRAVRRVDSGDRAQGAVARRPYGGGVLDRLRASSWSDFIEPACVPAPPPRCHRAGQAYRSQEA